jgi:hypothetical protein
MSGCITLTPMLALAERLICRCTNHRIMDRKCGGDICVVKIGVEMQLLQICDTCRSQRRRLHCSTTIRILSRSFRACCDRRSRKAVRTEARSRAIYWRCGKRLIRFVCCERVTFVDDDVRTRVTECGAIARLRHSRAHGARCRRPRHLLGRCHHGVQWHIVRQLTAC